MLQEAGSELERIVHTLPEKTHETLAVELVNSLQIREDDVLFTAQRLRQRETIHLGNVVVNDVLKRTDVTYFSVNKLLHYQRLGPTQRHRSVSHTQPK